MHSGKGAISSEWEVYNINILGFKSNGLLICNSNVKRIGLAQKNGQTFNTNKVFFEFPTENVNFMSKFLIKPPLHNMAYKHLCIHICK